MKKLLTLVLCLIMVLCAVLATAEEPVTITIMHYMGNTVKIEAFDAILAKYQETHPNVTFEAQMYSQNDYIAQLPIRIANGDTPDIMMGSPNQYSDIIDAGKIKNLTGHELITKLGLAEGDQKNCQYNGEVYALPLDFKTYGVIYNKAIFEKYGLTEPKTQGEFDALCKVLKDNGVDPFIRNNSNVTYPDIEMRAILWPLLLENGNADAFEKLMNGEAQFTDYPEFAKAFELWGRRLAFNRIDDMSNDTTMARQKIAAGEAAMIYDGTWAFAQIQGFNPEVEYGMFVMPRDDGKENAWCIQLDQLFMVSNESKHEEAVMEFMAYLLSPETAGFWSAQTLSPSVVPGVETEMPEVIMAACKGKESGNIAHEGAFTTWLKSEYLTAWRQITQTFCADETVGVEEAVQLLQDTFDEINASK
ncbi:MAG: extracellular solute-binding protein [Clostridia bacterium]|nr:extracellular solute-binding protein [Clostridia bacterium]